ncbi:MAG: DUF559 domain-containing protein [Candidatus Omnitrophica bacterium]|nr:DUF559 domain-containing protein [Candidatus Omnitrophota bacterium]
MLLLNRQVSGVKFRRQFSIAGHILDFYSPIYKLAIEADGSQHYTRQGKRQDEMRTKVLFKHGVHILRFSDLEILSNSDGVYEVIKNAIEDKRDNSPHLNPLPKGERR